MAEPRPMRVLVAGGGVAALETVLALRDLAGDRVEIALLAPERDFEYRPLGVIEPFERSDVVRFRLAEFAAREGIRHHRGELRRVRTDDGVVETAGGDMLPYDKLVVAIGGHQVVGIRGALTFRGAEDSDGVRATIAALREGTLRRLVFAVPSGTTWTLPLYELALQAAHALDGTAAKIQIVTPEPAPLAAFGAPAEEFLTALLAARGIAIATATRPDEFTGSQLLVDRDASLPADRVIALPRLVGSHPRGVPTDPLGFLPVDDEARVVGSADVYAVGDGASTGLKQGGLATQQADVAAAGIARAAGAAVAVRPFAPVLRGVLLTGDGVWYLRREGSDTTISQEPLWWPPAKIAGRYLGPYLATLAAELDARETRS